MEHLKKGETYRIGSINDLFNCPTNMMDECLKAISDGFKARIEKTKEKGYALKMDAYYFTLTNDGINNTFININDNTTK